MPSHRQKTGFAAEQLACRFLQQQGLRFITQHFFSPFGEIDLVMEERQILVFVEVRQRQAADYGCAAESVTYSKQQRIWKSAQCYLKKHGTSPDKNCRFDVVAIHGKGNEQCLCWIPDAFQLT